MVVFLPTVKEHLNSRQNHPAPTPSYVRPELDYGCEVVTLESKTNLENYDVVQNSALRIITGKAKSTPVAAMQLQIGIEPLDSRRDKFTVKFWERARRVECMYWNEYRCATHRLKTQISPLSHAELLMKKHQLPLLMTRRALIQCDKAFIAVSVNCPLGVLLGQNDNSSEPTQEEERVYVN
ncbi:putative reverse transcriptase [Trichonephila clavipes]|nr:putative reverse transcriptase [Trichonephila clavipes]